MALKPPGSRSNIDLIIFGTLTLVQVTILILGHVLIGLLLLEHFANIGKSLDEITEATGLPDWCLWLTMFATIAMDGWIVYHKRLERQKALRR